MIQFILTITLWTAGLFLFRPKPSDLQAKIPGYLESFKKVQGTFWLGILLIAIFMILSGGTFDKLSENWFYTLGMSSFDLFTPCWFVSTITHNFIHIDALHLWTNLSFLGILSLYERNVQAKRFLIAFLVSGVLSSISMLFVSDPTISAGASAGLFGLAAAYILDIPKLTPKEYLPGVVMLLFLFVIFSLAGNENTTGSVAVTVDTLGHVFGLVSGIIFCKLFPRKSNTVNRLSSIQ
jgi:rhomboid protease GluP